MSGSLSPLLIIPVVLVVVFFAQYLLSKYYDYKCGNCGYAFSPSVFALVLTPHSFGTKLLKCPECGKWTWATRVPKE